MIVIFDIDGTLANIAHRLHFVESSPSDYEAFEANVRTDTVNDAVATVYRSMIADPNITVILLTGRSEHIRDDTVAWLIDNDLVGYNELIMKTVKYQQDTIQKREAFDYIVDNYNATPSMVFEDRAGVVKMWKELGLFVFNVDQHK